MKILKIKLDGKGFYPATIAQAVKDANFKKSENIPMTLGEVNLYLYNAITTSSITIDDDGNIYFEATI